MSTKEPDLNDPAVCYVLGRAEAQHEHNYRYTDYGTPDALVQCACGNVYNGADLVEQMAAHVEREAVIKGAADREACIRRTGGSK